MRILVTGAAGFIGSCLSEALLERGDVVIGLDSLDSFYSVEHKERNLSRLRHSPQFSFVQADLRDSDRVAATMRDQAPDAIAHLAAAVSVRNSVLQPLLYQAVNVGGTINVLEAARHHGSPRVVLTSSGSVYGASSTVPFQESTAAAIPLSPYAASKRSAELFAAAYHNSFGLPICVLRLFNVYGPHGRPDMMPWRCAEAILTGQPITLFDGGRLQRDWTYIDDTVGALLAALDSTAPWNILNIGSGRAVSNRYLVEVLEGLLGGRAIIHDSSTPPSEPSATLAAITMAKRVLGYEPQVDVEEGLANFVDWLRQQDWPREPVTS